MAGPGKAKHKKRQGKSSAHNTNPPTKQDGNSSFRINVSRERSENLDKVRRNGEETLPSIICGHSGEKITLSKIRIQMMSEESIACMRRTGGTCNAASLKGNVIYVANPQVNSLNSTIIESPIDLNELDNLDFVKFIAKFPNEMDLENWLETCSKDSRDYLIMNLTENVEYLTTHVEEWRVSVENIVIQTIERLDDRKVELRNTRLQNNERESLLKLKEELESFNSMLTEKENYLRLVNRELDRVNHALKRFCKSQSRESLLQAQKRQREILKMSKETEKQICELKIQFAEERRKIVELEQKLKLLHEDYERAQATPSYGL